MVHMEELAREEITIELTMGYLAIESISHVGV